MFACGDKCVRACAGPLAWGKFSSSDCPAGSYRITDAAQCQAAAMATWNYWADSANKPDVPRGCIYTVDGDVYLNTHPTGGASPSGRPLCAVGAAPSTTGNVAAAARTIPPPASPTCRCARSPAHVRASDRAGVRVCISASACACTRVCICKYLYMYARKHVCVCPRSLTHTHPHTHTRTQTHSHKRTRKCKRTHARTHASRT